MHSIFLGLALLASSGAHAQDRAPASADFARIDAAWSRRPRHDAEHLDVVTLNAWGLPYPVAWVDRRVRFPRIERFLQDADIDVAGLQEVWRGSMGLLRQVRLIAGHDDRDTGLALVSPHPVSEMVQTFYSVSRGLDSVKSKGVLQAKVSVPDLGEVWAVVTHLQAGGGEKNAAVRAEQVAELLAVVGSVDGPVVVMGDFNFHPDEPLDQLSATRLLSSGWTDAAADAGATRPTHVGNGGRFDRVYLRDGGGTAMRSEEAEVMAYGDDDLPLLSDHMPVSVCVSVEATR